MGKCKRPAPHIPQETPKRYEVSLKPSILKRLETVNQFITEVLQLFEQLRRILNQDKPKQDQPYVTCPDASIIIQSQAGAGGVTSFTYTISPCSPYFVFMLQVALPLYSLCPYRILHNYYLLARVFACTKCRCILFAHTTFYTTILCLPHLSLHKMLHCLCYLLAHCLSLSSPQLSFT